jgi:hypothetical protein
MLIRAGYNIGFTCEQPVPMLATLSVHTSRNKDLRTAQRIYTTPDVPLYDYVDAFGNICTRLTMPAGGLTISCGFVIEDLFEPDLADMPGRQHWPNCPMMCCIISGQSLLRNRPAERNRLEPV